jgi:hypothetical protein
LAELGVDVVAAEGGLSESLEERRRGGGVHDLNITG